MGITAQDDFAFFLCRDGPETVVRIVAALPQPKDIDFQRDFRIDVGIVRQMSRHFRIRGVQQDLHPLHEAGVRVIGTGRSDFPNQVNNVLVFPGIFKGALEARARQITEEMKLAAATAIAGLVPDEELSDENILPAAFDPRVADVVSAAVKAHVVD